VLKRKGVLAGQNFGQVQAIAADAQQARNAALNALYLRVVACHVSAGLSHAVFGNPYTIARSLVRCPPSGFCSSCSLLPVSETGAGFSLGCWPSAEDSFGGADSLSPALDWLRQLAALQGLQLSGREARSE
jgi:hypothetical protein